MSRYIDADALKETIASNVYPVTDVFNSRDYGMFWTGGIEKAIDEQLTYDVRENVRGEWIKLDMHAHLADHKCSACGQECYVPTCMGDPMYVFCPNCGADMRGES